MKAKGVRKISFPDFKRALEAIAERKVNPLSPSKASLPWIYDRILLSGSQV